MTSLTLTGTKRAAEPGRRGRREKYPLRTMKPGEHFFVEGDSAVRQSIATLAYNYGLRGLIATRLIEKEDGTRGWQVVRLPDLEGARFI